MPLAFRNRLTLQRLLTHVRPPKQADYSGIYQDSVFMPSAHGLADLGTPCLAVQRHRERRARHWHRGLAIGAVIGIFAAGALVGHNVAPGQPAFTERIETLKAIPARQAVLLLPGAKRKCAYDCREACTVCVHDNGLGEIIKTSMC